MAAPVDVDEHGPVSVAAGFYQALSRGDADAAAQLVTDHFASDAEVIRPASLPGGGTIRGVAAIVAFARAAAAAGAAIDVDLCWSRQWVKRPT